MVRQLLTFPRGVSSERVAVDVGRLVVDLQKLMHGTFPKNIDQRVECEPALPVVLGDATQLHQVLLNLCVNARDAMPGGGALTLSARCQAYQVPPPGTLMPATAGNYIVVTVSDTGAGIPADIYEQIFDPFFTTKDVHKGTGLGLSTVLGIIKGHAAFIKVESPPGEGATFTVYLPVDEAARIANNVVDEDAAPRGHAEKILFVDDEAAITEVMSAGLARLNYRSLTATDGADGLSQALDVESEIAAVITDLHMPHMDGLEMTRALLRQRPGMPVLVTSGRMAGGEAAELRALGVTHWLAKPFTEYQLAVALEALLSAKEA
jgi:CheY-like chemotaxis protein